MMRPTALDFWAALDTIAHFIGFGHAPRWLCDRYEAALWASVGDTVEDKPVLLPSIFWTDLDRDLRDPRFRRQYERDSREIQETDAAMNDDYDHG